MSDASSYTPEISIIQTHHRVRAPVSRNARPYFAAEDGPAHKKLRSNTHPRANEPSLKPSASTKFTTTAGAAGVPEDTRSKKARPALTRFNSFSSSAGQALAPPTKNTTTTTNNNNIRPESQITRRSARLMGGGGGGGTTTKSTIAPKVCKFLSVCRI
jgi:hypothetical protein